MNFRKRSKRAFHPPSPMAMAGQDVRKGRRDARGTFPMFGKAVGE